MKKDLERPADIKLLIDSFYDKVRADEVIGYLFNEVARVNWEEHLPVMYSFWEQVLFSMGDYKGNPMTAHQQLHQKSSLKQAHFNRWVGLFKTTVDDLFRGEKAELAKQRAESIATVMYIKILQGGVTTKPFKKQ
jgi:hemoglobin